MDYLKDYKANICNDMNPIMNINSKQARNESDFQRKMKAEQYSSDILFPRYKDGPRKGKLIYSRDERGNIVVDPTRNLAKEQLFIDFNLFNQIK